MTMEGSVRPVSSIAHHSAVPSIKDHAKIDNPVHGFHNIVRGRLAKITVTMIIAAGKKIAKNAWNTQSVTLRY